MVIIEAVTTGVAVKTGAAAIVISGGVYATLRSWSQQIGTYLVNSYSTNYRSEFTNAARQHLVFTPVLGFRGGIVSNHAHPHEADMRCQATTTMSDFINNYNERHANKTGFTPLRRYDISTSTREVKFGVDGTRLVFGDADLGLEYKCDSLESNHVVTMIDVDYYIDDFSQYSDNPIMISTAIPTNISGRMNGCTYRYISPDKYEECVAGGAKYVSGLWDYSPDMVRVPRKWLGFETGFTFMKVEKISQPLTPNRYIVCLIPKVKCSVPYWLHRWIVWLSGMQYDYGAIEPLSRVNNVTSVGEYLIGRFARKTTDDKGKTHIGDTVQIRLADASSPGNVTVPEELFQALCIQAREATNHTLGDTSRIVEDGFGNEKVSAAKKTILHDCVCKLVGSRINLFKLRINYQVVPEGSVRNYDKLNRWKPTAKLAAQPLVHNEDVAVCPVRSHMNDVACIHGRVEKVTNDTVPDARFTTFAEEFVKIVSSFARGNPNEYKDFVNDKRRQYHFLHPEHMSVVDAHQSLPNQRARREREDKHADTPKNKVKSFQKNEAYGKPSDPRNISTMSTSHTRNLSCYAYAASDHFKRLFGPKGRQGKWMLPGSKPIDIADAVHAFVYRQRGEVIETDYSRFDGTISIFLREQVEFAALRMLFAKNYRNELDRLFAAEINQTATTMHGVKYDTGGSRLSGSPLTTIGNTLINAFIAYCGLRLTGRDAKTAMRMIGPKYGDDGIDLACKGIKQAADLCGLTMKIIEPSSPGRVGFLGRVFPDARHYNTSYFDILRALKKIPVVTNSGVPTMVGLARKVAGYLATDPHTPILSAYCRALQRVYKLDSGHAYKVTRSEERYMESLRSPWPCAHGVTDCQVTNDQIAEQLGLTVSEMIQLDGNLGKVNTVAELAALQFGSRLSNDIIPPNIHFFDESPEGGRQQF